MIWLGAALIIAGAGLLWFAADPFVEAAARLTNHWGVSPILIGALVVGFGTSAPELVVSAIAAGKGELAGSVGNVIGSNAANLSLVLGTSAVIAPLIIREIRVIRREGTLTLIAMISMTIIIWDGTLTRTEGALLLAGMGIAGLLLLKWSRAYKPSETPSYAPAPTSTSTKTELTKAGISIIGIIVGAWMLVEGGAHLATRFGLTSGFVGALIFAAGTSLPELVTTIAAARRKATEMIVGNLLGSNLFNSLLIVGTAGIVGGGAIGEQRHAEYLLMMIVGVVAAFLAAMGKKVTRKDGVTLLFLFAVFVTAVSMNATT